MREEERVKKLIAEKQANGDGVVEHKPTLKEEADKENADAGSTVEATSRKRKKRWDVSSEATPAPACFRHGQSGVSAPDLAFLAWE